MLEVYSMGSHSGQQNFPFGYIPNELHGIGLPDFMTPGPPSGQPLLNEHENQTLNSFLNGFDTGGDAIKNGSVHSFGPHVSQSQDWMMPPTFVGSETSLRGRTGTEWQSFHTGDFTFGNDMNVAQMPQGAEYDNMQRGFVPNGQYDTSLLHHLHTMAHHSVGASPFDNWQQPLHNQVPPQMATKQPMRFGTDQHFQPDGYTAPNGQFEPQPNLDWLEAQSSANTTQPNTRPNTQPSSPVWTKKRKLEDFSDESRRNGFASTTNDQTISPHPAIQRHSKNSMNRADALASQPPTPVSGRRGGTNRGSDANASDAQEEEEDDDDDDDVEPRSPSPASWSANKARPQKSNNKQLPKSTRSRRKSTSSNPPVKLKPKGSRSTATTTARVPLSADQKKANHTNSEQRRRDATARAYAELYDLVPELEEMGKQSTMKKLEIVVAKVSQVKNRVAQLRSMLSITGSANDPQSGIPLYPDASQEGIPNVFTTNAASWQG